MWNDFNTADKQQEFDVIPSGTIVPVRMTIKPGGYDDPTQGWNGGYASCNVSTGSVYLSCEFVVLSGEYAKRKLWSLIGLHSPKGPEWQNMGRAMIRSILNSAYGLSDDDNSPKAQTARRIKEIHELDCIEFVARISVSKDQNGNDRNEIKSAITADHKEYVKHKAYLNPKRQVQPSALPVGHNQQQPVASQASPASTTSQQPTNSKRPHWAS